MVTFGVIDRDAESPSPYRQIAADLREAIRRGELAPGDKLPSETELIDHYHVARMTVRQAVAELRGEGLVIPEHGRGVFVRSRPPVRRPGSGPVPRPPPG